MRRKSRSVGGLGSVIGWANATPTTRWIGSRLRPRHRQCSRSPVGERRASVVVVPRASRKRCLRDPSVRSGLARRSSTVFRPDRERRDGAEAMMLGAGHRLSPAHRRRSSHSAARVRTESSRRCRRGPGRRRVPARRKSRSDRRLIPNRGRRGSGRFANRVAALDRALDARRLVDAGVGQRKRQTA